MPIGEASFVVREVAQALHHAYWSTDMAGNRLNVVHRDVSPHNIILSYEGAVKLLDFGVAMSSVTDQADMVVGKWQYMSPEHTTPQKLDHRSDLFSLGVILYLLCTGSLPFTDANHREIVRKVRAGQYKPMHVVAPGVPQQLSALVAGLLSPDPNDRPQTGQEVATILTEIARGYGYERSSSDMVRFLADNFPDEQGDSVRVSVQTIRQAGVVPLSPSTTGVNAMSGSTSGSPQFATAAPAARPSRPQTVDSVPTVAQVSPPRQVAVAPKRQPEHPNIPKLTSGRWPLFPLVIILAITVAVFVYFLLTS
jgi:serine/threonine protein kinase